MKKIIKTVSLLILSLVLVGCGQRLRNSSKSMKYISVEDLKRI